MNSILVKLGLSLTALYLAGCATTSDSPVATPTTSETITPSASNSTTLTPAVTPVVPENTDGISEADAKAIALAHAGLAEGDVTFLKVEIDYENGTKEYEVEFYTTTMEYDYDINATTGAIISFDHEMETQKPSTGNNSNSSTDSTTITEAEAKSIALKHAGVSESDATFLKCKLDWDDGIQEYEVEFYVGNTEYDYEINATTGAILSYDHETETPRPSTGSNSNTNSNTSTTTITETEAKSIALKHAGVSESDATFLKCKLDWDDGIQEYEVEFYVGNTEYDYEINATTGAILSFDHETETPRPSTGSNSNTNSNTSTTTITEAEAKSIALKHAGVSESDATFLKCKLDWDDGIQEYEVEFYVGNTEYDYEINATTGAILSYDHETETPRPSTGSNSNTSSNQVTVTETQAKSIALTHAKVTESEITNYKCELDFDDGIYEYEIEWKIGRTEYEYKINATSGTILEFDVDYD